MRIWDINPTDQTVIDPTGRECPIDPMTGEPKVPGTAMNEAPPATGEHEAARAVGSAWEVVADWRGHVYWTDDGERHEITELGMAPPADALDEAPPEPIGDLAERQRNVIDTARDAATDAGFSYQFGESEDVVQTRARDRENITGLAVSAQLMLTNGDTTSTLPFRAQSDTTYQLTAQEILDLAQAAQRHVSAQYAKAWELKDQIEAARMADDRKKLVAVEW